MRPVKRKDILDVRLDVQLQHIFICISVCIMVVFMQKIACK